MAENVLGTASVLIVPNLEGFRQTLKAEIQKATLKPIPVPVVATTVGGKTSAALKETTTQTKLATEASIENSAALQAQGARASFLAQQELQLAAAEEKAAAAAAALAAASRAGASASTALGQARAVVLASDKALADAEAAVAAALSAGNAELISSARLTLHLAEVQQVGAAAALKLAGAQDLNAKKTAEATVANSQFTRGAVGASAGMLGLKGAILSSSGPFLAATIAAIALQKAVKGASEDEEALAATSIVLGDVLANRLAKQADNLVNSFGLVDDETLRFESSLAQIFKAAGLNNTQILKFSDVLVKLAADIAAVKDVPVKDVFDALSIAVLGNLRGLRALRISLTATEVNQRAMADSGKATAAELTNQEKILARYELILERTTNFQGGFAAESNRLSAQSKILRANIDQLSDSLGTGLLPLVTEVTKDLVFMAQAAGQVVGAVKGISGAIFGVNLGPFNRLKGVIKEIGTTAALGPVFGPARLLRNALDEGSDAADRASHAFGIFAQVLNLVNNAAQSVVDTLSKGPNLEQQLLQAQISGNQQQELAVLEKQIDAAGIAVGRGKPGSKEFTPLLAELNSKIQERKNLLAEIAAGSKQETTATKSASDAVAKKNAADQAFLDRLEVTRTQGEIRIARAGLRKGLADDIRAEVAQRNLILRQIDKIKQSNIAQKLKTQAIQALTQDVIATRVAIRALFRQQQENRRAEREQREAERQARLEALVEGLQLDVEFQQIKGNRQGEINARLKLIAEFKKELRALLKAHKGNTNAAKELRNQIAAEQKAIDDLKKQTQERNNAAASLQFEFLQAQQGFAATILSNLLPAGSIGATVGGGAISLPGPRPEGAISQAAQTAAAGSKTTTQGQTATMIEILRQILRVLDRSSRGQQSPEARRQRAVGSATMDIL